jgi:hypothetical protein
MKIPRLKLTCMLFLLSLLGLEVQATEFKSAIFGSLYYAQAFTPRAAELK